MQREYMILHFGHLLGGRRADDILDCCLEVLVDLDGRSNLGDVVKEFGRLINHGVEICFDLVHCEIAKNNVSKVVIGSICNRKYTSGLPFCRKSIFHFILRLA